MKNYNQTDQYIHQISQILAKLGRTFVPHKDDDSHTNLYWEPLQKRMLGRWITTKIGSFLPAIQLDKLSFQWLDAHIHVIEEVLLADNNYPEMEALVEGSFRSLGIEKINFRDPLHFDIHDYSFKNQSFKKIDKKDLAKWSYLRSLANHMLKDIESFTQKDIEVRIWPHHFDTGILFQWTDDLGIGAGLAMEDTLAGAPYFYISGYAGENQIAYADAMPLSHGIWIKQGPWKGGILPISQFNSQNAENVIHKFYTETIQFLLYQ
jgi:hypothetical protein